jgi:hypothetical protein
LIASPRKIDKSVTGCPVRVRLGRTHWEVVYAVESVEARNAVALTRTLEHIGLALLSDQITELYRTLVRLIYDAGLATTAELSDGLLHPDLPNARAPATMTGVRQ